jgi:hypothetical protein
MKSYLWVLIFRVLIFLAFVNIALGAVSDSDASGAISSASAAQVYPVTITEQDISSSASDYPGQQNDVPLPYQQGIYAYSGQTAGLIETSGAYPNYYASSQQASLPAGAPIPPNPNAENLNLPDYNMYKPVAVQSVNLYTTSPQSYAVPGGMPASSYYPAQSSYPANGCSRCSQTGSKPSQTCTSCMGQTPVPGMNPQSNCATCTGRSSMATPAGYPVHEYYVQLCQGQLSTTAGIYCGQWLPLWSKISKPGDYWSFEWALCGSQPGYYCPVEIKNFGYKGTGWYQTSFRGDKLGWHILCYCCGDWSNYVYIYVWPA